MKVVLITGGTRGLGLATAQRFSREGVAVALIGRDRVRGEAVAKDLRAVGGEAVFVRADLAKADEVPRMVDTTIEAFGRLDYAVNNAAHLSNTPGPMRRLTDVSTEDWD